MGFEKEAQVVAALRQVPNVVTMLLFTMGRLCFKSLWKDTKCLCHANCPPLRTFSSSGTQKVGVK